VTFHVSTEIATQPDCWRQASRLAATALDDLPRPGERVAFVGCGTSWFMGQALAALRESRGLGESDAFTASELPRRHYDRVVALTRSGTTSEVVDLLAAAHGSVPTTVIVGDLDTPAARGADSVVDLSFADERSVVQTRFATSVLALFRAAWGEEIEPYAHAAQQVLDEPLPAGTAGIDQISFLGRGWSIGIAHEAALKFRETSSSWAESYPAFDYRHGPIAIASPGRAVWMFGDPPAGLAEDVLSTGAAFIHHDRDPMVDLVLAQRVAVDRAIGLGLDPDQPRHLSRSVILTA
jgi:fructoselysine-6-P-deglycase FrlB-like protein